LLSFPGQNYGFVNEALPEKGLYKFNTKKRNKGSGFSQYCANIAATALPPGPLNKAVTNPPDC
jgi:hypothetical protein